MKKKVPVRGRDAHLKLVGAFKAPWELRLVDPGAIRIAGREERLRLAIWATQGVILSAQVEDPGSSILEQSFAEAVRVSGSRPDEVRLHDGALMADVQALVGAGVRVTVGTSREFDAAVKRLLEGLGSVADSAKLDAFLAFLRAPSTLVEAFAGRAAALAATKPWACVDGDDDAMLVRTPGLSPASSLVLITGQLGEAYAALVFDSLDDYYAFRDGIGTTPEHTPQYRAPFHAISFDPVDELSPDILRRLRSARYPVPGRGFVPLPTYTERYDAPGLVTPGALARLTLIADALQRFFAQHGAAVRANPHAPVAHSGSSTLQGSPQDWSVEYPHPELLLDEDPFDEEPALEPLMLLTASFTALYPEEVAAAEMEIARAARGRAVSRREADREPMNATSLPRHWAATSRPSKGAGHPLDLVSSKVGDAPWIADAAQASRQQRVLVGEIVDLFDDRVVVQSLVDGERYEVVDIPEVQRAQFRRWIYLFALVTPLGGTRWRYPSALTAQERFTESLLPTLIDLLRSELRAQGRADEAGETELPRLLLRQAGIAQALFVRMGQEARERPKKRYLENSDGDRVEFQAVKLRLGMTKAKAIKALANVPELVRTAESEWCWLDLKRTSPLPNGEALATIGWSERAWVVTANSATRADKLVALVRERLGVEISELSREVELPWRGNPGLVDAKGDDVEVQTIANGPAGAGAEVELDPRAMILKHLRDQFDQHIPMLNGTPREAVTTAEGRALVERWLRGSETRGVPGLGGSTFFDADPLRRELGLPALR